MEVEKTIHFLLDHQAAFATDMEELREMQRKTDERINNLTAVTASLVLTAQAHQASLDAFDAKWKDFLDRFDAWLRGQGGNGNP